MNKEARRNFRNMVLHKSKEIKVEDEVILKKLSLYLDAREYLLNTEHDYNNNKHKHYEQKRLLKKLFNSTKIKWNYILSLFYFGATTIYSIDNFYSYKKKSNIIVLKLKKHNK